MNKIRSLFTSIRRHKIRLGVVLLVIIGLGWWGVRSLATKTAAPTYQTASAEVGTLVSSISASGTVTTGSSVNIVTNATGTVSQLYVQNGDQVQTGQKIAVLKLDLNSQQNLAAAWSSYLSAQNSLLSAQNQLNALQATEFQANQAFINGAVANSLPTDNPTYIQQNATWMQAENNYINQKSVIAQVQAALASASLAYQQVSATIYAPASGTIRNLTLTPGLTIAASTSSSSSNSSSSQTFGAVTLAQGTTQASVNISEVDVTKVKLGQKVTMTLDAFPDKTFTGKVISLNTNGVVSSGVTTYPATVAFDSLEESIYPNMAVTAKIITKVDPDVVLVPIAAVTTSNGQSTVRVMKNGQVSTVDVSVGDSNDTQTEIISGIQSGDLVVTGTTSTTSTTTTGTSPFGALNRGGTGGAVRGAAVRVGG